MNVSVLVPYRGSEERQANWQFLRELWRSYYPEWQLVVADSPGEEWCKADAVAECLKMATGDIIVMADADVWCWGVGEAVTQVASPYTSYKWAVPHLAVHRLTRGATEFVLTRGELFPDDEFEQHPYQGVLGGGMFVMKRNEYVEAPLDNRFKGWGQEDESAGLAWTTLYGLPWRGVEPLWHMWHEPMVRKDRATGSDESRDLWRKYRRALRNRSAMKALVAEGKKHGTTGSR